MRNLFALVGAATITFVGAGWYLGWYKVNRQVSTPGTQRFSVEVSPSKIASDGKIFIEKVEEAAEHLSEKNSQPAAPEPAAAPANDRSSLNQAENTITKAANAIQSLTETPPKR